MSNADTTNKNTVDSSAPQGNRRRLLLSAFALVALAAIVIPVCVVTLRPETVPVIETEAEESLPSLLQVSSIGTDGGAILIEHTNLLEDESVLRYYVNVQDLGIDEAISEAINPDNVVLYLTATSDVKAEDLPGMKQDGRNLRGQRDLAGADPLRIGLFNSVEFPFRLPDTFVTGEYRGFLLVEEFPEDLGKAAAIVSRGSFTVVADIPDSSSGGSSSSSSNMKDSSGSMTTDVGFSKPPMASEQQLAASTDSPIPPPMVSSVELVLTSDLQGAYNLDRVSITIDTVANFRDGTVVEAARLVFDVPRLADAPGPYLYLSKRPFSETRDASPNNDEDLYIPIESGTDGQFNVQGRFEQFLLDIDVQDLSNYDGGSWIVWCRPFGVWLGGGAISTSL